jgi:hypothetical protein
MNVSILMKLGMHIMTPEAITAAYFTSSHTKPIRGCLLALRYGVGLITPRRTKSLLRNVIQGLGLGRFLQKDLSKGKWT